MWKARRAKPQVRAGWAFALAYGGEWGHPTHFRPPRRHEVPWGPGWGGGWKSLFEAGWMSGRGGAPEKVLKCVRWREDPHKIWVVPKSPKELLVCRFFPPRWKKGGICF